MKPGTKLVINKVKYTVDLVGPRTTLLIRGDGVYVHANTAALLFHSRARVNSNHYRKSGFKQTDEAGKSVRQLHPFCGIRLKGVAK